MTVKLPRHFDYATVVRPHDQADGPSTIFRDRRKVYLAHRVLEGFRLPKSALEVVPDDERPLLQLGGRQWPVLEPRGLQRLLVNAPLPTEMLGAIDDFATDLAVAFAVFARINLRDYPRGVYSEPGWDDRCWSFVFGTDGYGRDPRVKGEVRRVHDGLFSVGAELLGYGVDPAQQSWALVVRPYTWDSASSSMYAQFKTSLHDLVKESWQRVAGEDTPASCGERTPAHELASLRFFDTYGRVEGAPGSVKCEL